MLSDSSRYVEWLKRPSASKQITALDKRLCPNHDKLKPLARSPMMAKIYPEGSRLRHSRECEAITKICGEDESKRVFLLGRLDAMCRYANANRFAEWPKWARNDVRHAQKCLAQAVKCIERYEQIRKDHAVQLRKKLNQEGVLIPLGGQATNLSQLANMVGIPLQSRRAYLFNDAQRWIFANIVSHLRKSLDYRALAKVLSEVLAPKTVRPKSLSEWVRKNRPFIKSLGPKISIY